MSWTHGSESHTIISTDTQADRLAGRLRSGLEIGSSVKVEGKVLDGSRITRVPGYQGT